MSPAPGLGGVRLVLPEGASSAWQAPQPGGGRTVELTFPAGVPVGLRLDLDLVDAVGYWDPDSRAARTLLPGGEHATSTSLVHSAPLGCLYDARGAVVAAFALDEVTRVVDLRVGVSERSATFVVQAALPGRAGHATVVRLRIVLGDAVPVGPAAVGARRGLADVVRELSDWAAADRDLRAVPAFACRPVYSTWYAFGRDVCADDLLAEAGQAATLGFGSVFLDDGWQAQAADGYRGCGAWLPDAAAFPDLAGTVRALHGLGLAVVLWVAPLLLGESSSVYPDLAQLAPVARPEVARVLDPRLPAVRAHLTETCLRLVREHGVDGLKLDFLDDAMVYRDAPVPPGAEPDVGVAVATWLDELTAAFAHNGSGAPLVELRQPYVSPALRPHGTVVRAVDCPGDAVTNRVSVLDARLTCAPLVRDPTGTGGRGQVVHSDMAMWDPHGPDDLPAWQLGNAFLAVPQVSVRLTTLPTGQRAALAATLSRWLRYRDLVLTGDVDPGPPTQRYVAPVVRGEGSLRVVHGPAVVRLTRADLPAAVLNATGDPWLVLDLDADLAGADYQVTALDGTPLAAGRLVATGLWRPAVPPHGELKVGTDLD